MLDLWSIILSNEFMGFYTNFAILRGRAFFLSPKFTTELHGWNPAPDPGSTSETRPPKRASAWAAAPQRERSARSRERWPGSVLRWMVSGIETADSSWHVQGPWGWSEWFRMPAQDTTAAMAPLVSFCITVGAFHVQLFSMHAGHTVRGSWAFQENDSSPPWCSPQFGFPEAQPSF